MTEKTVVKTRYGENGSYPAAERMKGRSKTRSLTYWITEFFNRRKNFMLFLAYLKKYNFFATDLRFITF